MPVETYVKLKSLSAKEHRSLNQQIIFLLNGVLTPTTKQAMTYPESEFYDCITLARQYDTSVQVIKELTNELREQGYEIEVLYWGKQKKLKVNGKQLRCAILSEYGVKKGVKC